MRYILLLLLLVVSCSDGEFLTSYEEIENYKLRPIALRPMDPEIKPGDTVTFEGFFAGAPFLPNYNCSLSFNYSLVAIDGPPNYVAADIAPLSEYAVNNPKYPDSIASDYVRFSFRVPDSVFYKSTSIAKDPLTMLDDNITNRLPDSLKNLSRDEFIEFAMTNLNYDYSTVDADVRQLAAIVAQLLTIQMRVKIDTEDGYKMESVLSIRMNKVAKNNELIHINTVPNAHWMGVYTVKEKDLEVFNPNDNNAKYDFFYLFKDSLINDSYAIDSVILINNNYSYFIATDSGIVNGVDYKDDYVIAAMFPQKEIWYYSWFFQQDANEIKYVADADQFNVTADFVNQYVAKLFIPKSKSITNVSIWCKIYDFALGERNRPIASSVNKVKLYFKY